MSNAYAALNRAHRRATSRYYAEKGWNCTATKNDGTKCTRRGTTRNYNDELRCWQH